MKLKAIAVLVGAVVASSFSAPVKFGPAGSADAADAIPPPAETIKIPEFVPVVNFSEFVMAMQTFAAENPPAARIAAEALSAKFASNAAPQQIVLHPEERAESVIVTRPVAIASIPAAESTESVPAAPDPIERPALALADPIKVMTRYSEERPVATSRPKREKKDAAASRARVEKQFQPAMGLGMVIDSAEDAPPITSLTQKKRKTATGSRNVE